MYKIHKKLGNFWIVENDATIAMCTKSKVANRIVNALRSKELATSHNIPSTAIAQIADDIDRRVFLSSNIPPSVEKWLRGISQQLHAL